MEARGGEAAGVRGGRPFAEAEKSPPRRKWAPEPPASAFAEAPRRGYAHAPARPDPRGPPDGAFQSFYPYRPGPDARGWPPAGPKSPASQPGDEGYAGRKEPRAKKPGKYICYYCGRACAKPSVLKKHIRSHTGERPYPCVPCGFSFKTKSNLYKHRKSHAHAIKAGLAPFSEPAGPEPALSDGERSTDTDEEGAEGAAAPAGGDGPGAQISFPARKSPGGAEPAYADSAEEPPPGSVRVPILIVPKARGSERHPRRAATSPGGTARAAPNWDGYAGYAGAGGRSPDLLSPRGKGSTDSGYFSRSESAEQQAGAPNANVKTYEELMFGRTWYYRPNSRSGHLVAVAHVSEAGGGGTCADARPRPAGLLEPPSDSGALVRSNSVPAPSPPDLLGAPPGIRGSRSFELLGHEGHGGDGEARTRTASVGKKPSTYSPHGLSEIATRKRRKPKSVGDEEDGPDDPDGARAQAAGDHVGSDGSAGKAPLHRNARSQSDCSEDAAPFSEPDCRKAAGHVISVIQHTNSLGRPNSLDKPEPAGRRSDSDVLEDAPEPGVGQGEGEPASLPSLPGRAYHAPHKLVRQPNIQVPEIRVTDERDAEAKEAEKAPPPPHPHPHPHPHAHVEEFQPPQRSDTLSQMPSEKLPPKKKRLRLADVEHSSGESSFESAGASLSRSPSQESNLSHSSSLSLSLDRDDGLKAASPTRLEEPGGKMSEFLTVPGAAPSGQRQQREMRRSSSEQAPCSLPSEVPDMRSKSFDYGSLSSCGQGELCASVAAAEGRRRGFLVRQASLSVYPEAVAQEAAGGPEPFVKREGGSPHRGGNRTQRVGGAPRQHVLQQSISEDSLLDEPHYVRSLRHRLQAQGSSSEGEHEPFFPLRQPAPFWGRDPGRAAGQRLTFQAQRQLQKLHIQSPDRAAPRQRSPRRDGADAPPSDPAAAFREREPGASSVPVRVQTHVPSYGSVTYTSVSQLVAPEAFGGAGSEPWRFPGRPDGTPSRSPRPTPSPGGAPSPTSAALPDASGPGAGGGKRVLSPTSSSELFADTKQQKRVKEERMFGQMLKEMSAVGLSGAADGPEEGAFGEAAPRHPRLPRPESFGLPPRMLTDPSRGRDPPEDELDAEAPRSDEWENTGGEAPAWGAGQSPELSARQGRPSSRYPSLRTGSRVSWCFLNYAKPNSAEAEARSSIYASWCVSSYNPNPLNLSTKAALTLLRSKQRRDTEPLYSTAAAPPGSGKLVSSAAWKLSLVQSKPEPSPPETGHFGRRTKDAAPWARPKEERPDREASLRAGAEPTRVKIFEGGFKSNEDYVYVRGRGRGKYICEECGIRCKKPSMLKKHIRTHTDVRPYVCKFCNFAFKTKGNLTKHMKSKAHLKKCLELGVSTACVDDGEADDADVGEDEGRRKTPSNHQFSDADDSEEDGDEVDEEDEEDDEEDGDSTPRTWWRSVSPYGDPAAVPSIRITAQASPPPSPPPSQDEDLPSPSSRLSSPGPDFPGCPTFSPCSSPSGRRYLSPRRELSPRRGRLSLLAPPPPRPVSPGKRELSPRGRHRATVRANSPRRGLHQHLLLQSQQAGARGLRSAQLAGLLSQAHPGPGGRRGAARPDTDRGPGSPGVPEQSGEPSSPPHQVLFSHLPLHSQLQVRSPFPMIPIGGIQMVRAPPPSPGAPPESSEPPPPGIPAGGQEENIRTCTEAIASLRIRSGGERGPDGAGDPQEGSGHRHFSTSPRPPSPASSPPADDGRGAESDGDVS
ncbi:transcription factor HIVEP2a isoform X2 [Stigmatopora argus]